MILPILCWLPVKSLIRFSCVSKRFRSLILTDPKFAKSQFQAARDRKTVTRRLLYKGSPGLESIDLETPSFGDCSSKLKFPLELDPAATDDVSLLGSCNGIVFPAVDNQVFYMWNPSTGFSKKLPGPGIEHYHAIFCGVGYFPATDDYRLLVAYSNFDGTGDFMDDAAVFSSRANAWETFEFDELDVESYRVFFFSKRLHWINCTREIVAFDLAQQQGHKFRKMLPPKEIIDDWPKFEGIGLSSTEYLLLASFLGEDAPCIHVRGMREYDVPDSWTKLFNLKFLDPPKEKWRYISRSVFVMETSTVFTIVDNRTSETVLVKSLHEGDECSYYKAEGVWNNILYQESLLWIDD